MSAQQGFHNITDMADNRLDELRKKLESIHSWPSVYMFKFIVPAEKEGDVLSLFPRNETSSKSSKNGRYVSVTAEVMIGSTDQVIEVYEKAYQIEALIAL